MARGLNKVMLIGHLGADPELKYTANGTAVTTLSVATNSTWKDASGNQQERTEWHRVVMWQKLAEIAGQYLKKGSQVYIEGRIQTRSWEDKDGKKQYTTEIVANQMQMLGKKGEGGGPVDVPPPPEAMDAPEEFDNAASGDDDLPF